MAKKKSSKPRSQSGRKPPAPLVDPAQAAAAAAALVAHHADVSTGDATGNLESAAFRHLKDSISKGHIQSIGNLLNKTAPPGQNKPGPGFGSRSQVGHNQTFGSDVNRRGVPRRTAG